jgi:hypothetical protein
MGEGGDRWRRVSFCSTLGATERELNLGDRLGSFGYLCDVFVVSQGSHSQFKIL